MRRALIVLSLIALVTTSGCVLDGKPSMFSARYGKRLMHKIIADFHDVRIDFDRIVWDLEEIPVED